MNRPLSNKLHAQVMPQPTSYIAGFAAYITLAYLDMLDLLSNRSADWWFNEIGILLQLIGAMFLVFAGFQTRKALKDIPDSWEARLAEKLRDAFAAQAFTGLYGFVFLGVGQFAQLVAGLVQK